MVKSYLTYAVIILLVWSCKSETMDRIKDARNQISNAGHIVGNASNISESTQYVEKRMKELRNIVPLSNDEFMQWMPETLKDLQRSSYQFSTAPAVIGNLSYSNDEKVIDLSILDGAGVAGSAMFASQSLFGEVYTGYESESDSQKQSVEERNGIKTMETYFKQNNRSEIRFVVGDRFIVTANGKNMTTDELYGFIESLDLMKLSQ